MAGQLAVLWGAVLAEGSAVRHVKLASSFTAVVDTIAIADIVPKLSLKREK